MPRNRLISAGVAACLGAALFLVGCDSAPRVSHSPPASSANPTSADPVTPASSGPADLAAAIIDFGGRLKPTAAYRDPTAEERSRVRDAVDLLLVGRDGLPKATGLLTAAGYRSTVGTDSATGREYAIYQTEPGSDQPWGMLVVDLSRPARLAIEVPHPNSDLQTEGLGALLFRAVPGSVLLVAGSHRRAAKNRADAAHNPDGIFQVVAGQFARARVNQIQLHGFAEQSLPGTDAVVSNGQRRPNPPLRRVADALQGAGFATCRAWTEKCGQLEGTTNVQADEARRRQSVFIHVEITGPVRRDPSRGAALVAALATADLPAD
ncbi:hypothetical protein ACNAW0_11935 [Micromonospora sp. SL1-18]|uniref:hypothetical protein n=1 Tax=Micromonospora sp. SL1-18 TaxID=3399128 RepID=UPI003A4D26B0